MSIKIANIAVDHSKPGYVIISEEDWKEVLNILTEGGAEIDHYAEHGIMEYFRNINKE